MTDKAKSANNKVSKTIVINSHELRNQLSPYYDMIISAKQSVLNTFLKSSDYSLVNLELCITKEAEVIDNVNSIVCVGFNEIELYSSLKPVRRTYKKFLKQNPEKPPFFHLSNLKSDPVMKIKSVAFFRTSEELTDDGFSICRDNIFIPELKTFVVEIEKLFSCKLYKMEFYDDGSDTIDGIVYTDLTILDLKFKLNGED